jgi:hypothetical protein
MRLNLFHERELRRVVQSAGMPMTLNPHLLTLKKDGLIAPDGNGGFVLTSAGEQWLADHGRLT